jgi:Putative transposase
LQKAFDSGKLQFLGRLESFRNRLTFFQHLAALKEQEWVVYAKRPFGGPQQVLDYVGRYTHRVAISNNRLLDIENDQVRFQWKDYRTGGQVKTMTLSADEFIRRFLLHVLPHGFQRIRYYGFLGNRYRQQKLDRCRRLLGMHQPDQHNVEPTEQDYRDRYEDLTGTSLRQCPQCQRGRMVLVALLPRSSDYSPVIIDSS